MAGGKYEFTGAQTVKVYSMGTAEMNDYKATGSNRYGNPEELEDTTEELTLTQKRSFTFTIDATNAVDSPAGIRDAAKALRRQLDQVVIPEVDAYRFRTAADKAKHIAVSATSNSTAYSNFLAINSAISDDEVPAVGRVAYVSNAFLNAIKQCDGYTKASELAQNMLITGQVGDVDGVKIVAVPKSRIQETAVTLRVTAALSLLTITCSTMFLMNSRHSGVLPDMMNAGRIFSALFSCSSVAYFAVRITIATLVAVLSLNSCGTGTSGSSRLTVDL